MEQWPLRAGAAQRGADMSAWTSSERFWMDVMNISLGLLVLGMLAAVVGGVVLALVRRDPDAPPRRILVKEPVRTVILPRRFNRRPAAGREARR